MKLCERCLEAAEEEGAEGFEEEALELMGEDIADHICDEIETDGELQCSCPCARAQKRKLRASSREEVATGGDY